MDLMRFLKLAEKPVISRRDNMWLKQGYKVLRRTCDGLFISCSATGNGTRIYQEKKWTRRGNPKRFGPLAVFDDREKAYRFALDYLGTGYFPIVPCEYTSTHHPSAIFQVLWGGGRGIAWIELPEGTKFADAVRLLAD